MIREEYAMATITEKSRTKEIIDRLQGIIDNASPVPLAAGKVTIYKDEVKSLLSELASQIDIEGSKARSRTDYLSGRALCKPHACE